MRTTKELLGERIRELRKVRGFTQEQLAEYIEVEQKHVSRLELGKSFPTIERLEKIADALNVPIRDFFDYIHLADIGTRTKSIEELLKCLDEDNQKIAYKIFRGVVQSLQDR
ncbi:MAG: helix-turn-helix transcriptional regulator [Geobacteraceae bacterium]|nr:helix-turn-helix transcriptional regulator [Geobacteraceae bacterium]